MSAQKYYSPFSGYFIKKICSLIGKDEPADVAELSNLLKETRKFKVKVPDSLHFVWVGEIGRADFSYLPVWRRYNPDKTLFLWTDPSGSNCSILQNFLADYSIHCKKFTLNDLQDCAFEFIFSRICAGETFNRASVKFMSTLGFTEEKNIPISSPNELGEYTKSVTLCDIQTLFTGDLMPYRKLYYYEIILRGNLAAASDIIRLMVLYKVGGIYVDLDMLPEYGNVFHETHMIEKQFGVENSELTCLAKSAAFMAWFRGNAKPSAEAEIYIRKIKNLSDEGLIKLVENIDFDIRNINEKLILPLGEVFSYPELIRISTVNFMPGVYFNSFLCSAPGSRLLRVILRTIARRYAFLRRNNFLFSSSAPDIEEKPSGGLQDYRTRHDFFSDPVTIWLTGPGVIIGTVIELIDRFMPPNNHVSPQRLAERLQNEDFGVTLINYTLDTPMGLK